MLCALTALLWVLWILMWLSPNEPHKYIYIWKQCQSHYRNGLPSVTLDCVYFEKWCTYFEFGNLNLRRHFTSLIVYWLLTVSLTNLFPLMSKQNFYPHIREDIFLRTFIVFFVSLRWLLCPCIDSGVNKKIEVMIVFCFT